MCTYYSQWPVKLGVFMYNIARYKLVTRWCHYGLVNLVSGQKMYIHTVHLTHSSAMQVYTTTPPPPPPPSGRNTGSYCLTTTFLVSPCLLPIFTKLLLMRGLTNRMAVILKSINHSVEGQLVN